MFKSTNTHNNVQNDPQFEGGKIYSIKMILIATEQNLGTNYRTTIQTSQKTMGVQLRTEGETVAPKAGPASDKKRAGHLEEKDVE